MLLDGEALRSPVSDHASSITVMASPVSLWRASASSSPASPSLLRLGGAMHMSMAMEGDEAYGSSNRRGGGVSLGGSTCGLPVHRGFKASHGHLSLSQRQQQRRWTAQCHAVMLLLHGRASLNTCATVSSTAPTASLYLDGCTELGQLLLEEEEEEQSEGVREATHAHALLSFYGGATLSLSSAVRGMKALERLLTWPLGSTGGTLRATRAQKDASPSPSSSPSRGLQELRLSGCRALRPAPLARPPARCCPKLRVLSLTDTFVNDTALRRLCEDLQGTLVSLELRGALTVTDVRPLLRCVVLQQARLPGGQLLTSRNMSVECGEGLIGICAVLRKLCPDLRRLQLHGKGSTDVSEVAQMSRMGRWLAEVDLSLVIRVSVSTILALSVLTAPANGHSVLTRLSLSNTTMNNTMLRALVDGVVLRCVCIRSVACGGGTLHWPVTAAVVASPHRWTVSRAARWQPSPFPQSLTTTCDTRLHCRSNASCAITAFRELAGDMRRRGHGGVSAAPALLFRTEVAFGNSYCYVSADTKAVERGGGEEESGADTSVNGGGSSDSNSDAADHAASLTSPVRTVVL